MRVLIRTQVLYLPKSVSPEFALDFYRNRPDLHDVLMVVASNWRVTPESGEEDWFEELTADEFEQEDFLEEFADAHFQLWPRS